MSTGTHDANGSTHTSQTERHIQSKGQPEAQDPGLSGDRPEPGAVEG